MDLINQLEQIPKEIYVNNDIYDRYSNFYKSGNVIRESSPKEHLCCYFLPYDPRAKEVFLVHHKNADLWISPGGHVDANETLEQTVSRELAEELQIEIDEKLIPQPFLCSITDIAHDVRACKTHYDIWYLIETDKTKISPDMDEFHDTKWLTVNQALNIVTEPNNRMALNMYFHTKDV